MRELQWYLETFLDYPFPPDTDRAERVLQALRDWGEQAFRSLFEDRSARRMFDAATTDYSSLHLQISSDDPGVMAWPWEALRDPELGVLAHAAALSHEERKTLAELLQKIVVEQGLTLGVHPGYRRMKPESGH